MPIAPKIVRIQSSCQYLFTLLGSTSTKAVRRMLMKLSLSVKFHQHFTCTYLYENAFLPKRNQKKTFVQKLRILNVDDFGRSMFEAATGVVKIGFNLKPNHHKQVKFVKIRIMHCILYGQKLFSSFGKWYCCLCNSYKRLENNKQKIFHFYDYFLHFTTSQKKAKKKFANYLTLRSPFVGCENLFFTKRSPPEIILQL